MKKPKIEHEIILETPIQYHFEGQVQTSFKLMLKAPGNIHSKWCNQLLKAFFNSIESAKKLGNLAQEQSPKQIKNQEDKKVSEKSEEDDGSALAMAMTIGDDMDAIHESFKEFMCFVTPQKYGSVCMIDNVCPMTTSVYEKMSLRDTNRLIGVYIQNFLIPS